MGVQHEPALPFASSLCGACGEVCPVKIDNPKILLELRSDVKKSDAREGRNRLEKLGFCAFAWLMTHPRLFEMAGRIGRSMGWPTRGWLASTKGPLGAWLSERDLPPLPAHSFREMWRRR
jgi:L-lactate dehydrogenase complex protein LldF